MKLNTTNSVRGAFLEDVFDAFNQAGIDLLDWLGRRLEVQVSDAADWEESEDMDLPFMDAVRFVLAREFHLNGKGAGLAQILRPSPFFLGRGGELQDVAAIL